MTPVLLVLAIGLAVLVMAGVRIVPQARAPPLTARAASRPRAGEVNRAQRPCLRDFPGLGRFEGGLGFSPLIFSSRRRSS
jgi:hypothetical protein